MFGTKRYIQEATL